MGRNKALIEMDGQPLVARAAGVLHHLFRNVVVVTSMAEVAAAAGVTAIPDVYPGKGPLAGIHAALQHWNRPTFCVASDMPFLNEDFIRYLCEQLEDHDVVVPRVGDFDEPLHAVYAPACLAVIERELQRERVGPVPSIYQDLNVRYLDETEARKFDPDLRMFENWNTPYDLEKGLRRD